MRRDVKNPSISFRRFVLQPICLDTDERAFVELLRRDAMLGPRTLGAAQAIAAATGEPAAMSGAAKLWRRYATVMGAEAARQRRWVHGAIRATA